MVRTRTGRGTDMNAERPEVVMPPDIHPAPPPDIEAAPEERPEVVLPEPEVSGNGTTTMTNQIQTTTLTALNTLAMTMNTLVDRVEHINTANNHLPQPLLTKMTDNDDPDNFFNVFEVNARQQKWLPSVWSTQLSALLSGRALAVYCRLSPIEATSYDVVKAAILKEFQLDAETYRQRFRAAVKQTNESFSAFSRRLEDYAVKWLNVANRRDDPIINQIVRQIVLEQLFTVMPNPMKIALQQHHHFQTPLDAAEAADRWNRHLEPTSSKCYLCNMEGHFSRNCPQRNRKSHRSENAPGKR